MLGIGGIQVLPVAPPSGARGRGSRAARRPPRTPDGAPIKHRRGAVAASVCGLLLVGAVGTSAAHVGASTGYATITVDPRGAIQLSLTLWPGVLPSGPAEELRLAHAGNQASTERVLALLRDKFTFSNDGHACAAGPGYLDRSQFTAERVTLVLAYACPPPVRRLTIRDDVFDAFGPDHHTLARIDLPGASEQFAFTPDTRAAEFRVTAKAQGPRWSGSFFLLGIEHILSGYDHLLFLLGLLLRGGGLVSLLKIVTAFTVAHSVTLALAVLDIVALPDRLVESVIALSIAYIAAENLFLRQAPSQRWIVSFLFGLVHGFGFASALRELGLPRSGLIMSLFGFNLGVEAGQAMVVAIVFPPLLMLRRTPWEGRLVLSSSLAILLLGLVFLVERLFLA